MYEPPHFRVEDREVLHAFVRAHALGLIVIVREGRASADAMPFLLDVAGDGREILRAHCARANPLWRDADGREALVVFQGPDHYVSPGWYPSKAEGGRVVPTWNYALVQARGVLRVREDAGWLRAQASDLTGAHEASRPAAPAPPWGLEDAPEDFIAAQMRAIVGIEIEVAELRGKFKLSQNRPSADRAGVEEALGDAGPQGARIAAMMAAQKDR